MRYLVSLVQNSPHFNSLGPPRIERENVETLRKSRRVRVFSEKDNAHFCQARACLLHIFHMMPPGGGFSFRILSCAQKVKSKIDWEITSWKARAYEISEIERVIAANEWDFWYSTNECENPVEKRFPCYNLFILYIVRFSHPQKYILALDKCELRSTRVHRKYYLVKAARQSYPRWPRKSPRKHNSRKPWFVIGRNDFFTCRKWFRLSD